jgi:hypothetical protein
MQLTCEECGAIVSNPPSLHENFFVICPDCNALMHFDSQKKDLFSVASITPNPKLNFFFSHSFKEDDKQINDIFRNILLAFYIGFHEVEMDMRPQDKLTKARDGIKNSDYFFVLMTKRYLCYENDIKQRQFWKSSEWIQNEIGMAYSFKKKIISMVEMGIKDEGMLKDVTWCRNFDREKLKIPWIKDNNRRNLRDTEIELIQILFAIDQFSKQHEGNITYEHQS